MNSLQATILPTIANEGLHVESLSYGRLKWVYVEKPTRADADYLGQIYHFHPLNLDDILSRIQRPKIDEYQDHLFLVLHFPVFNKETDLTVESEVDIFIGENYLVCVHCSANLKPLSSFFRQCQDDDKL